MIGLPQAAEKEKGKQMVFVKSRLLFYASLVCIRT